MSTLDINDRRTFRSELDGRALATRRFKSVLRHIAAIAAVAFALLPILWVISSAFNPRNTLSGQTSLIPTEVSVENFRLLFNNENVLFATWVRNSLIVAGVSSILQVAIAAFAAYAFSRFRFKGRRAGMMTLLMVQIFPQFLAITAIYYIMTAITDVMPAIGKNTLWGLVLVYLGGALGVNSWLIKGFFDTVPKELDESAAIDGAGHAQTFFGIILPLAAPAIAVVGTLSFIGTLNDFILASVLLTSEDKKTAAVGLQNFISVAYTEQWGPFTAGALILSIPVVLLFLFLQRYIVEGLAAGSVKG